MSPATLFMHIKLLVLASLLSGSLIVAPVPGAALHTAEHSTVIAPGSKEDKEARALALKVVQAHGGLENIISLNQNGYHAQGILEQISSISGTSNKLDCLLISKGIKQYLKSNFMGQTVITCFDGESCWTQQGNHAMPTDRITSQRILEDQLHGLLLLENLQEPDRAIREGKPRKLRGKKYLTLIVTANDGKDSVLYIDPRTYLVARTEYTGTDTEQGVNCVKAYEYADYKELAGTRTPYRLIEYSDLKRVSDFQIQKYDLSSAISDDIFQLPAQEIPERLLSGPVYIPFQLVANEILIKAKVNGERELTFLIDTGATQSILDSEVAKSLGIRDSGDFNITTGSGAMKMQFMTLDSVRLGDLTVNNISVAVAPLKNFAANLRIKPSGLIGANLLKRFQLTIDYPERKLVLRRPDTRLDTDKGIVVETKPSLGVSGLAVEGVLDNNLKLTFLLDSGAAFNHVSEHLVKDVLTDTPILPVGSIKGLDGKVVKTGAIRFKTLKIGQLSIKDPIFSIAPGNGKNSPGLISGGNLAIIGNPLLSRFRVTIDYAEQKILFEKSKQQRSEEALLKRLANIKAAYYSDENRSNALNELKKLKDRALTRKQYGAAGEILSEFTYLAAVTGKLTSEQINKSFSRAVQLAMVSNKTDIESRILATWARYFLSEKPEDYLDYASSLISRAMTADPTQSDPYAIAATMLLDREHQEKIKKKHKLEYTPKAVLMLDQSLMLNPSNWMALWTKYDLAREEGRKKEMSIVAQLLRRYYPDARQVRDLKFH